MEKECNHEVVFGGPYLTKAIENAYKDINPEEAARRLELAILKRAAEEDRYDDFINKSKAVTPRDFEEESE